MRVFVCGSKNISALPEGVKHLLYKLCSEGVTFLIGDCYGIDRVVQQALFKRGYPNVVIYTACIKARNNVGGWPVVRINPSEHPGYAGHHRKDTAMINDCDTAIAVWDGKSKGTGTNIVETQKLGKEVALFI